MIGNTSISTLIITGGHHTSALALAEQLTKDGWQIIWLGHRHSQWHDKSDSAEFNEVTASGLEFINLKAGKLYRTYHPLKLLRIPWGFIQAFWIIFNLKIKLGKNLKGVITFGGYLGVPVVVCAWLFHIPCIAHEQTVIAGWANKIISFFVKKIAVSWQSSISHYPKEKVVLTGLPFRSQVIQIYKKHLPRIRNMIYITGGKQGSHIINQVIFEILPQLLKNYQVIHQTGSSTVFSDYQTALRIKASLPADICEKYQIAEYYPADKAAEYLATVDVVISRSGAHIVQELMLFGTKSVLIPISWASHNEQSENAKLLTKNKLAIFLPESQLNGTSLTEAIRQAQALKAIPLKVSTNGLLQLVGLVRQEFGNP